MLNECLMNAKWEKAGRKQGESREKAGKPWTENVDYPVITGFYQGIYTILHYTLRQCGWKNMIASLLPRYSS
jgi:hypothetical protein